MPAQPQARSESVAFGDDAGALDSFRRDGYVVVCDVLSAAEVAAALDELWESPRLLGRGAVRREDPSTWGSENWPQQEAGRNFLSSLDPTKDRFSWELSQHPRVVHLMELLYGGPVLAEHVGRWGVMRPTDGHPEWRTDERWLHWDQNPWREPGFVRVQGLACLTEQTAQSGGFLCVPGFHTKFAEWGAAHPEGTVTGPDGRTVTLAHGKGQPFPVPEGDPAHEHTARVLAPQGAVVLWDSRLPHQNYPNDGGGWRVVHYLPYVLATPELTAARGELMRKRAIVMQVQGLEKGQFFPHGLTALGRKVNCVPADCWDPAAPDPEVDPRLARALQLALEAAAAECSGDAAASAEKHRLAAKAYPGIDCWYEALFGT